MPAPKSIFETISAIWFQQQFEQLHKENALILKGIADIQKQCSAILLAMTPNLNVAPELELAVLQVAKTAISIDQKVPDKP